ncbi:RNA polymerase sigma factor [Defluviitalea raffinosedens]|uniref:RNA polymerase sigma factor n=1 Tax=Defluviitalea raffinosedens TaxID=1450156 RepID=UPI00195E2579|nr:RNA polymerase sigma-70 factor (ECF subfamily) [Defluviitalea raffinosedens]
MENKDEKRLVNKAKNGNIAAFEELITAHEVKIYNIAYRMFHNEEDAKDLSQEIFIKVFENIGKFKGNSSFSTWLYRIATNTCIDELRRRKGKETYSIDAEVETDEGNMKREYSDLKPNPEEMAINKEVSIQIQNAMDHLSEEHKTAIILRDLQGLEYNEISEILECSLGTVKSRISRARRQLIELLVKQEPFEYKHRLKNRKEGSK